MSNWHELTKVLYPNNLDEPNSYLDEKDRIVRKWVGNAVEEIARNVMPFKYAHERREAAKSILGLTEKEEVVVEKKLPYWCRHMDCQDHVDKNQSGYYYLSAYVEAGTSTTKNWKACPECLTPRPSEPSKREIVAEILWENSTDSSTPYPCSEWLTR